MKGLLAHYRDILRIALPAIVSNVTVPLLGLVDTAIVGHLGSPRYIGAIAVGGMIFNLIYWTFGFLRMGTSGFTAQAFGAADEAETRRLLLRTLSLGALLGLLFIVAREPLLRLAFVFIECSPQTEQLVRLYFGICIWGAPAVLMLNGMNGWLLGMQNARYPMYVAIVQNLFNIAASLFFVFVLGLKIEGVAAGTLLAQYVGLGLALLLGHLRYARPVAGLTLRSVFRKGALRAFFGVNRDIFLRTLCLVVVLTFFTSSGAAQGDDVLAANALLLQLYLLISFFSDGFAFAGEALSGRFVGARAESSFRLTTRRLFRCGLFLSFVFTVLYAFGGQFLLSLLTDQTGVVALASRYLGWIALLPLVAMPGFLLDGVFVGATATRYMLLAAAGSAVVFFLVFFGLFGPLGNHALWFAFVLYMFSRGLIELLCYPHVVRRRFALSR